MLSYIASAFISLSALGQISDVPINAYSTDFKPEANITLGEFETDMWHHGIIGRH